MYGRNVLGGPPRPGALLVGNFSDEDQAGLEAFFKSVCTCPHPGAWQGPDSVAAPSEVDVVVLGHKLGGGGREDVFENGEWYEKHLISFRSGFRLPGPKLGSAVVEIGSAATEAFSFPPGLHISLDRLRRANLNVQSARGWNRLLVIQGNDTVSELSQDQLDEAAADSREVAVVLTQDGDLPLAVAFVRERNSRGVACLPRWEFDRVAWVRALCRLWAEHDPEGLGGFQDWLDDPAWLLPRERHLIEQLDQVEKDRVAFLEAQAQKEADLQKDLEEAQASADAGARRLVTAQGDELVAAVAEELRALDFEVDEIDNDLDQGQPRKEDLRIRDPAQGDEWEAIAEVRGYKRSSGKTADLGRLNRFAVHYETENGRPPSQRIYMVNGPLEEPPDQRQEPLAAASEDVEVFAESDGVVMSTIDLYKLACLGDSVDRDAVRAGIRAARGRWQLAESQTEESDAADDPTGAEPEEG